MKDLTYYILLIITFFLLFGVIVYGVTNEKILNKLESGEITVYDEVYTCNYKGKYVRKNVFVPAEIEKNK